MDKTVETDPSPNELIDLKEVTEDVTNLYSVDDTGNESVSKNPLQLLNSEPIFECNNCALTVGLEMTMERLMHRKHVHFRHSHHKCENCEDKPIYQSYIECYIYEQHVHCIDVSSDDSLHALL